MPRLPLTVTIITLNEEKNIRRAIQSVHWADEILVVDSGSIDKTVEIAKSMGARVLFHAWPGYGQQKNFAQQQATYDWILNLDADEVVSEALALEIQNTLSKIESKQIHVKGFSFPRKTYYLGRWIEHGGWYPNYLVRLADRNYASWTEPNVHEELKVRDETSKLTQPLHHYAFTSIMDQILTNLKFSKLGSLELERKGQQPSLFRLLMKPLGKFLETYLLKRGFLDGLAGFIISVNAAHSMFLKYAYLYEGRIRKECAEQGSERNENINC